MCYHSHTGTSERASHVFTSTRQKRQGGGVAQAKVRRRSESVEDARLAEGCQVDAEPHSSRKVLARVTEAARARARER